MKKLIAEFLGTFVLVLFGCGAAVLAGQYIGFAGIALAFGLAVMVMIYAVGHISGGHFNPAVTVGLASAGQLRWREVLPYVAAQLAGAICAAGVLYLIATGKAYGTNNIGLFAANTWSVYTIWTALITELVLTAVFVLVILGSTSKNADGKFAGISIGLALTAIHLVSIPVTNTSVNPARSTSQAIFAASNLPVEQLWLFWIAPIAGAIIAGLIWKYISNMKTKK